MEQEDKNLTDPIFEDEDEQRDPLAGNGKERFHNGLELAASLVELNFLFIFTCIPIFTIGASITALFTTITRMMEGRGASVSKMYFQKFKENFKQSTLLWIPCILLYGIFALDIYGGKTMFEGTFQMVLYVVAAIGIILVTFVLIYGLSMIGLFENTLGNIVRNSLILSLGNAPKSFVMTLLSISPFLAMYWAPDLLGVEIAIMILVWWSAVTYADAMFLKDIYAKYMKPTDPEEQKEE